MNDKAAACAQGNSDVEPRKPAIEKLLELCVDVERIRDETRANQRAHADIGDSHPAAMLEDIAEQLTAALAKVTK